MIQNRNYWGNKNKLNPRTKYRPNRHWDPKTHKLRMVKFQKLDLPDFDLERRLEAKFAENPAEMKEHLKKKGIMPPLNNPEFPMFLASSSGTFEPYIPREGEGAVSMKQVSLH